MPGLPGDDKMWLMHAGGTTAHVRSRRPGAAAALALALLGSLVTAPTPAGAAEPSPGAVLTEQRAQAGPANRVAGMPTSADPGRQLTAAT